MKSKVAKRAGFFIGILFCCLIIQSCSNKEKSVSSEIYVNNFDNYLFYGFNHYSLSTQESYSGKFSCATDKDRNFGMGMRIESQDLIKMAPENILISGWVFCEDTKAASSLVVSIDEGETNLFWYGIDLTKNVTNANEWTFIKGEFKCPEAIPPGAVLSFYLWNTGGKLVYIDDQTIEFIKK